MRRRSPAAFVSLLACAAVVATSRDGHAWQCFPEPAGLMTPAFNVPAPRNTHVRVRLRHGPSRDTEPPAACEGPLCDAPGFGFALRPAGHPDQTLPMVPTKVVAGEVAIFDLRPLTELPARTRFEVYRTDRDGRDVRLLSSFTTSDSVDRTRPVFPTMTRAVFHPFPLPRPPSTSGRAPARKVITLDFLEQFAPYVGFEGPTPEDAETRRSDLAYFVWSAPAGPGAAPIDYNRPPDTIVSIPELFRAQERPEALFFWGSQGICFLDTMATPRPKGLRRVGVRVVDLAGNRSEPQEREIDFGK